MQAAIASGHQGVSEAGAAMLRKGGNAIDAVVAAGFASSVLEIGLTSLASAGFALVKKAGSPATLYDFCSNTPSGTVSDAIDFQRTSLHFSGAIQDVQVGWGAVAVPGMLKGLLHLHACYGTLSLAEVITPAIGYAQGHSINSFQLGVLELIHPILQTKAAAEHFFFDKNGLKTEYSNPELEQFLRRLPDEGDENFYRGEIAERWLEQMAGGVGLITEQDLRDYRVVAREPLQQRYRDVDIISNPAPSFGGGLMTLGLALLEAYPMAGLEFGSVAHLTILHEVMDKVDALRAEGVLQPEAWRAQQTRGTTHISVCDAEGNAVSMTSSTGETSGCFVPTTGIMLNNLLGEDDLFPDGFHNYIPQTRVASMMSPSMLLQEDAVQWVLGTGGSKRIRTALMQVISNIVDFNMDIRSAIDAPRAHWDGTTMQLEPDFPQLDAYRAQATYPVNVWDSPQMYFGGVHSVSPHGFAAGDARRSGAHCIL